MGMNLDHGGHLTHGSPVNMSGKYFEITPYGVNEEGVIDYEEVTKDRERVQAEADHCGSKRLRQNHRF